MSNYTKTTTFANKTSADTIDGADFDVEFAAYQVASATKADKNSDVQTDNILILNSSGGIEDGRHDVVESRVIKVERELFSGTFTSNGGWEELTSSTLEDNDAVRAIVQLTTPTATAGSGFGWANMYARPTGSGDVIGPITHHGGKLEYGTIRNPTTLYDYPVLSETFEVACSTQGKIDFAVTSPQNRTYSVYLLGYVY